MYKEGFLRLQPLLVNEPLDRVFNRRVHICLTVAAPQRLKRKQFHYMVERISHEKPAYFYTARLVRRQEHRLVKLDITLIWCRVVNVGKLGDAESAVKRSFILERIFYRKISADNLCCFFISGTVLRKLRKKLLWLGKALVDYAHADTRRIVKHRIPSGRVVAAVSHH